MNGIQFVTDYNAMDWVDKLNRWALKGIRQEIEKIEISSEGAKVIRAKNTLLLGWSEIEEIGVVNQLQLASGSFALVIRRANSSVTIVDDTVVGYSEFCEELARQLPGVVPYSRWATEMMAKQDPGQVIFRRNAERNF